VSISLIVAVSTNNVIGVHGELPWHISEDLRRFRELTTGKTLVMGRKTFDSIGQPLPKRRNIVITRDPEFTAPGCDIAASPDAAIEAAGESTEIMVIGGSQIYAAFLPRARRIYLTRIHAHIDGDTYFAALDEADWKLVACEEHAANEARRYSFAFMTYDRS
jgi:dihydrofolate reductase